MPGVSCVFMDRKPAVVRTHDTELVSRYVNPFLSVFQISLPKGWIEDDSNIVLTNSANDFALFERMMPGVVTGHYFFQTRGKQAIKAAEEFITELFSNLSYDVYCIRGLVPIENRASSWITRRLGFTLHETVETTLGLHEVFTLTKQEWKDLTDG